MTVNIRTTFEPDEIITVSDAEYLDLLRQGLVYSVEGGAPIDYPDFSPAQYDELDIRFARSLLANRLGPIGVNPFPAVTTDMPTVTWGSAPTITARLESPLSENLTILGRKGSWNSTFSANQVSGSYSGRDFLMDGDTFELSWVEQNTNGARIHIFVDGAPTSLAP